MKYAWLLLTLGACASSHVPTLSPSPGSARVRPAPRASATVAAPPELVAYCDAASKRRAAFRVDLTFEVRAASLSPRQGYREHALLPEEQAIAGQSQIFLGPDSAVTAADLAGGEIRPALGGGGYDVSVRVKSATALAPRLEPLVDGIVAVLVDGRLLTLPHLQAGTVAAWPVALGLALPAARATAARLGPRVDEAALQHLEEACLGSQGALCLQLAEERLFGRDAPYDAERALTLFEAGCRSGSGAACKRAADLATPPERAAELLDSGCRLNDPDACLQTAARLLHRPGTPEAIAEGKAILTRSCDRGRGSACMALADELSRHFSGDAPPPLESQRAWLDLVERACTGGDADACFTRARVARQGLIGPADAAAAKHWLQAGCALDPSGGSTELEAHVRGANPDLLKTLKDAGCTGEFPRATPHRSLCTP